jgi:peptide/nickel transport system substrate-binding protein
MEMNSLWRTLVRERKAKPLDRAQRVFWSLTITEKVVFLAFSAIFIGAALSLTYKASTEFSTDIPHYGGELVEGVVGTPRFINPLLAVSDADRDLTALVYSGLLKATPEGDFIPDLAESFVVSPDGREYSFTIRPDATFHDGEPVTAADVEFTILKAQDSALKSPRRISFEGVTVTKTGVKTVVFSLKQPYAPFMNSLAIGILPKHLWQGLSSDQIPFSDKNIDPVGSGPYEVRAVAHTGGGIPSEVVLKANPDYALGRPYIATIRMKFYQNERALATALEGGEVESASNLTPTSAKELEGKATLLSAPLTRIFGIFFNQNENELLASREIRKALALAIDKGSIIDEVLAGYGTIASGPLPPTIAESKLAISETSSTTGSVPAAQAILEKAKWKRNPDGVFEFKERSGSTTLALSLSTTNIPELVESARRIEDAWTRLGAEVDVRVFEPTDLNQGVIRPRKYEALLFGIVTGKNSDLYPFWHSSQRNDPGLNVSLYTNARADKSLERMRIATSTEAVAREYMTLKSEIDADTPAIFLWSPDYIYAVPDKLRGVELGEITTPSDRFAGIERWHVETDRVWNIFIKDRNE